MKRILFILLFAVLTISSFGQSQFKYVIVPYDDDTKEYAKRLEHEFSHIGIYPISIADTYKNLSINPYEMIYVQTWRWGPFSWYIELTDWDGEIFYKGFTGRFFRNPNKFLPPRT